MRAMSQCADQAGGLRADSVLPNRGAVRADDEERDRLQLPWFSGIPQTTKKRRGESNRLTEKGKAQSADPMHRAKGQPSLS